MVAVPTAGFAEPAVFLTLDSNAPDSIRAVNGYELLKVSGKDQGLDALRQEISARFSRASRAAVPTVAEGKSS
jgi:hypothetical protein